MLPQLGIPAQRRDCRGLHRYLSSLVVLGLADQDHTRVEVDIIDVETDGLAHPHAGHGHQPDQRVIRGGGQRPGTLRCRQKQPGDVGVGHHVGVGGGADRPADRWTALTPWVKPVQVAGESSHHRQSLFHRNGCTSCGGWPTAARPDGRCRCPDALEVVDERQQRPGMVVQLETQRASNAQISSTLARSSRLLAHPRAMTGDHPQGSQVVSGVEGGARNMAVSRRLPDLEQRRAGGAHAGGRGVPQPVRADDRQPGTFAGAPRLGRCRWATNRPTAQGTQEQGAAAPVAATVAAVVGDCLAHVDRQRQQLTAVSLPVTTSSPVCQLMSSTDGAAASPRRNPRRASTV